MTELDTEDFRLIAHERAGEVIKLRAKIERLKSEITAVAKDRDIYYQMCGEGVDKARAWDAITEKNREIERLRAFAAQVRDAVEAIDPDVLPPNASDAINAVQAALAEISDSERIPDGEKPE